MSNTTLELIFEKARTYHGWLDKHVEDNLLQQIYDLTKWAPTSANCCPMRVVFVKSLPAKLKLKPCLAEGNAEQTMTAPVTAIFAYDLAFYDQLPKLFPHVDARSWYVGNDFLIHDTAFRNGSLQAAYFMLAARSLGLDCGPMSGFDHHAIDQAFFENTSLTTNFLCNLGYGDPSILHPRSPRLTFDETCKIL